MDSLVGCARGGRLVGYLGPRVGAQSSCGQHHYRHGSFVDESRPRGVQRGNLARFPGEPRVQSVERVSDWQLGVLAAPQWSKADGVAGLAAAG